MMRTSVAGLFAVVVLAASGASVRADDKCEIVAEITVEAVKLGATRACLTGSPIACAVAAALDTAAGDGLAKAATTEGCAWAVKKVGDVLKVTLKASGEKEVKKTEQAVQELKAATKQFKVK